MGRYCAVPMCFNSDVTINPKYYRHIFFGLPKDRVLRDKWVEAIGRNALPSKYNVFICEDHFDLQTDMVCYQDFKTSGGIPRVKPDVVPHKFDCQQKDKISSNKSVLELDRFKRRLIRAVARLLLHDKQPEEEAWANLRKETGCDCQLLWSRMRALTLKKLSRLLLAEDNVDAIPKPARMTLTDWLLFDLVLVHQKVDLLGLEIRDPKEDHVVFQDLFNLVKMFKIEGLQGDNLARAWSSATLYYNIQGHQCSPMLLQRRWYLLKEHTRTQFYGFWNAYRGTVKRLPLAEPFKPTRLEATIAKQYKNLVVSPFMEWEELIENRLVILPEEFERKMLERQGEILPEPNISMDNGPDLEVIEPVIETIDLRLDSDNENEGTKAEERPEVTKVKIKEEPQDMDIDIEEHYLLPEKKSTYEEVLESTTIENENLDSIGYLETQPLDENNLQAIEENRIDETALIQEEVPSCLPQITSVFGNVVETSNVGIENRIVDNLDETNSMGNVDESSVIGNIDVKSVVGYLDEESKLDENIVNDNIKETDENLSKIVNLNVSETIDTTTDVQHVDTLDKDIKIDEPGSTRAINLISTDGNQDEAGLATAEDSNLYKQAGPIDIDVESDHENNSFIEPCNEPIKSNENLIKSEDNMDKKPELDFKPDISSLSFGILSNDINFVDDGIELADDGIEYQDEDSYVDNTETKLDSDEDDGEEPADDTPKIDAKLLMCPIIYTTKLDDMGLFNTQPFHHVNDKSMLDLITSKSKPIKAVEREVVQNDTSEDDDCSENEVSETQKVKVSSYLLQKPRSRRYNTIQLCKNPDFNTRLKRLTVGFFSSLRNRALLKACKPLTIDLSKAFEAKLVAGTLYLKDSDNNVTPESIGDMESSQNASVVPSAMPVQSLIDNSKISDILPPYHSDLLSPKPQEDLISSERSKIINLPDISEIRRINQRLLTAEVTPIQVQNNTTRVPVSIVASSTSTITSQENVNMVTPSFSKGPPKVVDITDGDLSDEWNIENNLLTESTNDMRNVYPSASIYNKGNLKEMQRCMGRPSKQPKKVMPPRSAILPWRPRPDRSEITWLSRNQYVTPIVQKVEEHLLTLDTLNKVLYLLADKSEGFLTDVPKPKPTKKKKGQRTAPQTENQCTLRVTSEPVANPKDNKKFCKPKINIKPACPRGKKVNTPESEQNDSLPPKYSRDAKTGEVRYCCWAREKMLQMLFSKKRIRAHDCPYPLCMCCCRTLLHQYTINEKKLKNAEAKGNSIDIDAELPDDATGSVKTITHVDKATSIQAPIEPIETPDQTPIETLAETSTDIPTDTPAEVLETPDENIVESSAKTSEINVELPNEKIADELNAEVSDIPVLGGEICIGPTKDFPNDTVNEESTDNVSPVPAVSIKIIPSIVTPRKKPYQKSIVVSRIVQHPMVIEGASAPANIINTSNENTSPPVNQNSSPTLTQLLAQKQKEAEQKTTKSFMAPPKLSKPPNSSKMVKEKMIYLNSKQLAEKPTDNPIFLGKNKILLTTVKFPPNLRKFEEAKQMLKPSLNLPNGVELVCLPNGTVACHADPNVKVNAADLATIPDIIAAVQQKINLNVTVPQQRLPVTENEIVDLIDDDDNDSTSKVTKSKNKNLSVAAKQIIDLDDDDSTNKSTAPDDSSYSEGVEIATEHKTDVNPSTNEDTRPDDSTHTVRDEVTTEQSTDVDSLTIEETTCNESARTERDGIAREQITEVIELERKNNSGSDPKAAEQTTDSEPSTSEDMTLVDGVHSETDGQLNNKNITNSDILTENKQNISGDQDTVHENEIQGTAPELSKITSLSKEELPETSNTDNELSSRNKSKNILSDLMEMSGIFEEDITPTPQEELPAKPLTDQPPLVNTLLETLVPTDTVYEKPIDVNNVPPVMNSPLGELYPITSLYELKYACQNNGSFFKLDFNTGYLVPINVCMKQHQKPITPKKIDTKSVIDLTDDDDVESNNRSLLIASQGTGASPVKPVKLFKSVRPGIMRRLNQNTYSLSGPNKLKIQKFVKSNEKVLNPGTEQSNIQLFISQSTSEHGPLQLKCQYKPIKPKPDLDNASIDITVADPSNSQLTDTNSITYTHKQKRKQYLNIRKAEEKRMLKMKVIKPSEANQQPAETPITLEAESEKIPLTTYESDDSSDDEPLAKKAKRNRENDDACPEVPHEIEVPVQRMEEDEQDSVNMQIDNDDTMHPTHYELLLDQSDADNEEEQHCILGV